MWFDEENGKYLCDPTREYVDEAFQHALDTLGESLYGYYFVIALAETDERIGSACIFPDADGKVFDIGCCIHKSKWRQGYGREAMALLLDWLKANEAEKVTAEVAIENAPSNQLLRVFVFSVEEETAFQKYNMDVRFESYIYAKRFTESV